MAKTGYDDKFVDVMSFAEVKLAEKHERRRIRSDADLRALFQELDASRQGGEKRMSDEFIDILVKTHSGQAAKGKILPTGEYINRSGNSDAKRHFRLQTKFSGGIKNWRLFSYGVKEEPERETKSDKTQAKAQTYREQGKDVYYYKKKNGTTSEAVKTFEKGKIRFRDVITGRFARVKDDEE